MEIKKTISVDKACFFLWLLIPLLLPLKWVFGWTVAALVHEIGHFVVLYIFGVKIYSVHIGVFGTRIETAAIHPSVEAICALTGPIFGLLTLFFKEHIPYVSLAAFLQSMYNLLPVFPLDGGRALQSLLYCFLKKKAVMKITCWLSVFTFIFVVVCGVWATCNYQLGVLPVIFPAMPMLLTVYKNSLHCKQKNSTIRKRK